MSENLFCKEQKTTSEAYRAHWDRVFAARKDCETCKHLLEPLGSKTCGNCVDLDYENDDLFYSNWEAKS